VENDLRTSPSDATAPSYIKSSSRALRAAVHIPRSRVISPRRALAPALLLAAMLCGSASAAPTPAPAPTLDATHLNERLKDAANGVWPVKNGAKPLPAPTVPLHTEFVVETNAKGQIARVRSGKESSDAQFNAMTYGNVVQAFIRKADGSGAIAGTYRMTYDYDPTTTNVKRGVTLISAGGVNPNAMGEVDKFAEINRKRAEKEALEAKAGAAASPRPTKKP